MILFAGQNGAVKEISKNGWNNNHLSQIEDGLVKNSTANFRGRQTEASAPDPSGVSDHFTPNYARKINYFSP